MSAAGEPDIARAHRKISWCLAQVEESDVFLAWACAIGHPHAQVASVQHLMAAPAVLIDFEYLFVSNERRGCGIVARQIASKN